MEFFVESLSRLSKIKLVEELRLGTSNYIQSRDVILSLCFHSLCSYNVVLIANWKHMCVSLGPIKVIANYGNGDYVYLVMFTVHILLNHRAYCKWLHRQR
jgi:hypothetical protein